MAVPTVLGGVGTVVTGLLEVGGPHDRVVAAREDGGHGLAGLRSRRELLADTDGLDGIVVHGVFSPAVSRAARLLRRARPDLPMVAMPHDAYDDGLFSRRRRVKEGYFARIERPHLQACRTIVTTAPSHERWLRQRGIETPVIHAPLGLSAPERQGAATAYQEHPGTIAAPVRLLALGRWDVHEKGLDLAMSAVADCATDVHLRLVGPGVGQEQVVRELALGAGGRVELVGFVPDVWQELAQASLLLMPSRKEGFGIAALQAVAAGTPVLMSGCAGFAEHVGVPEGVLTTPPELAGVRAGLAEALARLPELTDGARRFAREQAASWTYAPLRATLDRALDLPD